MNGQDGISVSVRGSTEVVGVVVLVGMVITSATLLFVFASDAKRNIEQEIEAEEGVQQVQAIDSAATDISMTTTDDGQRINLGAVDPTRVHVVDAGTLSIELDAGPPDNPCSVDVPMSAVVVNVNDQVDVVYFAGGVWRVDEDGATVETPPEIGLDDSGTFQFSTYNFRGDFEDRQAVVSENSEQSQEMNDEVQRQLMANEACQEHLNGSVDNVSVTTTLDPSGPGPAVEALKDVVPAYQRHLTDELGMETEVTETASGGLVVGAELTGEDLPAEANISENQVVDLVGDGPGSVDDGTDSVTVDKDADNEYPVRMTLLATDASNVSEVTQTLVVPTPVDDVPVDRQRNYRVFDERTVDALLADPSWEDVQFEGELRTEAPEFEETATDLYDVRTVYEYQDVEAANAFEQWQEERVDAEEQDPLEVVFVMDESGSMENDEPSRISQSRQAAAQFVDVMQNATAASATGESHRAAVVGFGQNFYRCGYYYCEQRIRTHQELTSNLGDVQDGIDDLDTYGDTPLWAGVETGIDQLVANGEEDTNKIVVVLTDGKHNLGENTRDTQIARANDNDITVYTVGVADNKGKVDDGDLGKLANETGGEYTFVSESDRLESVFDRIVRDEITSNVTVRDPAPTQSVEMLVVPENESFTGEVPDDGVLTQYENRDVVIRPDDGGDAVRVSMADEDDGLVRVHYENRNDTFFYLNGTDPVQDARTRGAVERTASDDVVPDDPATREETEEVSVDQTVEIAAYEETPDDADKPAHDLELTRNGNTVYLKVDGGTLAKTPVDERIKFVGEGGETYYFNLTDGMIPDPGTVEEWVGPQTLPTDVDVQVLDGATPPADAEYVVEVDGEQVALSLDDPDWSLDQPDSDVPVFHVTDGEDTYRFDLRTADSLPEETVDWVPTGTTLDVIAYDSGDAPVENPDLVSDEAVELELGGTTYIVRPGPGETLRQIDDNEYVLEASDGNTYRFAADNLTAISETTETEWFDDGQAELNMTVYEDGVPEDATGLEVPVEDKTAVVKVKDDWDAASVSGNSILYEVDGKQYNVTITADDLPSEDERTEAETEVLARQVYDRPLTIDVTAGGETYTSPWTDADSGIGADVTQLDSTERTTMVTIEDGESLSFDAHVGDCGYEDREETGGTIEIGDDPTEYTQARCTAMEDRSSVDEVYMFTDGDTLSTAGDSAAWQTDLDDAIGSQYLHEDGTVNVSDNQVLVVVEAEDENYNYAAVLVEVGRDSPDVQSILEVDVSQIEIEDEDEDDD